MLHKTHTQHVAYRFGIVVVWEMERDLGKAHTNSDTVRDVMLKELGKKLHKFDDTNRANMWRLQPHTFQVRVCVCVCVSVV